MKPIRVVLADDHPILRSGLRSLLEAEPDIELVGEASDGLEALELVLKHPIDLLVTDIAMPVLNGLDLTIRLSREAPETRVLILSVHKEKAYAIQAFHSGAAGYLVKEAGPNEFLAAIRSIHRGETYLSPSISAHLVSDFVHRTESKENETDALTPRQLEVLKLVAQGHTTKVIARQLGIGVKTIETHRSDMMRRLGIRDVAGLVRYALRIGLIELDD